MEKNSDIVVMNCYAPLLVNVSPGARQWRPNLIGYDALRVYGSPSYYAIKMFSTHLGDEILKATATDTDVLVSATRDSHSRTDLRQAREPDGCRRAGQARVCRARAARRRRRSALTLAADPQATNSIDAPAAVVPRASTVSGVASGLTYKVPAHGIVVLTLEAR